MIANPPTTQIWGKKKKKKKKASHRWYKLSLFLSNYFHFHFFPVCRDSGHLHGWQYFIK
jgi:hypothetical protein